MWRIGFAYRRAANSDRPASTAASAVIRVASVTRAASACPNTTFSSGSTDKDAGARGDLAMRLDAKAPAGGPLRISIMVDFWVRLPGGHSMPDRLRDTDDEIGGQEGLR